MVVNVHNFASSHYSFSFEIDFSFISTSSPYQYPDFRSESDAIHVLFPVPDFRFLYIAIEPSSHSRLAWPFCPRATKDAIGYLVSDRVNARARNARLVARGPSSSGFA